MNNELSEKEENFAFVGDFWTVEPTNEKATALVRATPSSKSDNWWDFPAAVDPDEGGGFGDSSHVQGEIRLSHVQGEIRRIAGYGSTANWAQKDPQIAHFRTRATVDHVEVRADFLGSWFHLKILFMIKMKIMTDCNSACHKWSAKG